MISDRRSGAEWVNSAYRTFRKPSKTKQKPTIWRGMQKAVLEKAHDAKNLIKPMENQAFPKTEKAHDAENLIKPMENYAFWHMSNS